MKLRGFMIIMDSMTGPELDDPEIWKTKTKESRVRRIARGSGKPLRDVEELLVQYMEMAKRLKKGLKGLPVKGNGKMTQRNLQQVSSMLPPQMLNQMGGMGALKVRQLGVSHAMRVLDRRAENDEGDGAWRHDGHAGRRRVGRRR